MKKKILTVFVISAFAVIIGFNINAGLKSSAVFDVSLSSLEALAKDELPEVVITCSNPNCYGGKCHYFQNDDLCPCKFSGSMSDNSCNL